jgi:anti-sigma regulatory factor (Ser/Thr protein kinase)
VTNCAAADWPGDGPAAARPPVLVHDALFYKDEHEYLAGAVAFLRDSLRAVMPALVAVPGESGARIGKALGPDAARVRFVDMAIDGRNPNRIIPAVLCTFDDECPGEPVAIICEAVWPGRTAAEYPACLQHEALVNVVFAELAGTILCPYDSRRLEPEVLSDACRTHPNVLTGGERKPSMRYTDPFQVVREFNRPLPYPDRATAVMDFASFDDLPRLRDFVGRRASAAGLAHDRSVDLQMAANEIATNTIRHAGDGAGSARIWTDDGHVVCDITDAGHIEDPLAGRVLPPVTSECGRGLLVSNYLCDLVRIYSVPGLTTVRLFMRLS